MTIPTLLPVYQFAKVLQLHPLHVMGVAVDIGSAASTVCINAISQYSWQDADGVSREELSQAISEAENDLARELGYWPMPQWTWDERRDITQPPGQWYQSLRDIRLDWSSVKATKGYLIAGGVRAKDLILAGRPITYTDLDGDGYLETATVTCAVGTITDVEEIAVYYPDLSGDDEWEIRPINVSITGGTATITFRREQAVLKVLYERLDAGTVDGAQDANFLTAVDVYRKYHDPSVQAQLVWRSVGDGCYCSGEVSCVSCGLTIQPACMTVKDQKLGIVTTTPGTWDSDTQTYGYASPDVCSRRPDYVRLWYRSGWKDMSLVTPNVTMARRWQRAVAKLAISKLDRIICSCRGVSDVQSHWSADLRRSKSTRGESNNYRVTNYELENNPFGTTIAAMEVWRDVRRATLGIPAEQL